MTLKIKVDIVSTTGGLFSGQVDIVFVPAVQGEIGVLPRHAPLLSLLREGDVRVRISAGDEEVFYISGGVVEIQPYSVIVLADMALMVKTAFPYQMEAKKINLMRRYTVEYAKFVKRWQH